MADTPQPRKRAWLKNLEVDEISLVDRGANPGAKMLLWKSAAGVPVRLFEKARAAFASVFCKEDDDPEAPRTVGQILSLSEFWSKWYALRDALECSVSEILGSDAADKPALLQRTATEFLDGLAAVAPMAAADAVAKIDAALSCVVGEPVSIDDVRKTLDLAESEANAPGRPSAPVDNQAVMPPQENTMKTATEILAALSADERDCVTKHFAPKPAVVAPEIPADVRKMIDDERAKTEAMAKRLATVEDQALTERVTVLAKTFCLPGLPDEKLVPMLKSAARGEAIAYADLVSLFTATSEMAKTSALISKQFGTASRTYAADSASAKLAAVVKQLRIATPSMTEAQAINKAYELDNSLMAAHEEETRLARQ